jgi:putative lipoic acid-binding regulatory protein
MDKKDKGEQMDKLKELLDSEHTWPGSYLFKFIVPNDHVQYLLSLFQGIQPAFKESSKGKYISVSFTMHMQSSDEVLAVYAKAATVPGLLAL